MLLAIIAMPLYLAPAHQPGPAVSGGADPSDDPRIAGLVSTRALSDGEIAELRRHPDQPTPVQQPHYDNEVIVTAVIQNEIHMVAATPTHPAGSVNQVETAKTPVTGDVQQLAQSQPTAKPPAPSESQLLSPLPTPVSPVPTPISPLPTPEPPTPHDAGDVQAFVQTIVDAQNAYYTEHGVYAQVIFGDSPSCPGDCLNLSYPDGVAVAVNVYTSPAGDGYEVVIINDGWKITVNHGPESYRSTGWRRVYEP